MDLIQSFVYTIGRSAMTLYEQRLMLKIVEYAQQETSGKIIKNSLYQWQHDYDNVLLAVPMRDILSDGSQHYARVLEAAHRLMRRTFTYKNSETGDWFSTPIIYNVTHDAGSGIVSFYVARRIFDVILDFSKGFRQYNIEQAISLPSPYACRLFALMSGQTSPLTISVNDLKAMFGVEEKYKQTADFIKKVIIPAQTALDNKGCTSFAFNRVYTGNKVTAITFHPIRREVKTKEQEAAKIATSIYISRELSLYMMRVGGFSMRELGSHKVLLDEFSKIPSAYEILADVINRANTKGKSKGYVIAALRSELDSFRRSCGD